MKKFLIILTAMLLTSTSALAADVSGLYAVKNAQPAQIDRVLNPYIQKKFPNAVKQHKNAYVLQNKGQKYYYVIILANKNENTYFYYMSNNEDETFRKEILKTLKNNDFKRKKVFDSSLKSYFYGEAYTYLAHSDVNINMRATQDSGNEKPPQNSIIKADAIEYDFSDDAQEKFNHAGYNIPDNVVKLPQNTQPQTEPPIELNTAPSQNIVKLPRIESSYQGSAFNPNYQGNQTNFNPQTNQIPNNVLTGSVIYVQDGTTFTAALLSDISSDSLTNNDRISAELDQDWIYNGQLIAPSGSILSGNAIDTRAASFAMKNGQIGLLFDEIMTPDGNVIPLKTNKVYIVGNSSRALNVTKRIAGGAATGLLLSAVSMLLGADPTHAIISGVAIGAGAGAISTISTRGEEIRLIEGSQLQIMLTEPLTVQLYKQH